MAQSITQEGRFLRPLGRLKSGVRVLLALLRRWRRNHQDRLALSQLSEHQLKDIGISREQWQAEMNKPFWR
ncbi:hypothetical protein GCM10023095_32250 [Pseudaeromonas paramecii]|uniref:YjiS-like domain-containing protein n=1 Tax=Pseudaeromonas paramecii TaxID=2138166 RepID=A0ABP8QMJ5_9GAMM